MKLVFEKEKIEAQLEISFDFFVQNTRHIYIFLQREQSTKANPKQKKGNIPCTVRGVTVCFHNKICISNK